MKLKIFIKKINKKIPFFNPYHSLFVIWETGIFFFLLFELIMVPYEISFISTELYEDSKNKTSL